MRPRLAIVVPVLDEAEAIVATLDALAPLRARGAELIVVDGGSGDGTPALAAARADRVLSCTRGRARQMNAGAAASRAEVLLFLHADTLLPEAADAAVLGAVQRGAVWGRFDVAIGGPPPMLRVVAAMMNLRSRLSGIATGDQALFMTRTAFDAVGGYPDQPLMEDVEITSRLRRRSRPACIRRSILTSARRWQSRGPWRTILLMWRLRLAYWFGASPADLERQYR